MLRCNDVLLIAMGPPAALVPPRPCPAACCSCGSVPQAPTAWRSCRSCRASRVLGPESPRAGHRDHQLRQAATPDSWQRLPGQELRGQGWVVSGWQKARQGSHQQPLQGPTLGIMPVARGAPASGRSDAGHHPAEADLWGRLSARHERETQKGPV